MAPPSIDLVLSLLVGACLQAIRTHVAGGHAESLASKLLQKPGFGSPKAGFGDPALQIKIGAKANTPRRCAPPLSRRELRKSPLERGARGRGVCSETSLCTEVGRGFHSAPRLSDNVRGAERSPRPTLAGEQGGISVQLDRSVRRSGTQGADAFAGLAVGLRAQ
jgi:hypothetical protein